MVFRPNPVCPLFNAGVYSCVVLIENMAFWLRGRRGRWRGVGSWVADSRISSPDYAGTPAKVLDTSANEGANIGRRTDSEAQSSSIALMQVLVCEPLTACHPAASVLCQSYTAAPERGHAFAADLVHFRKTATIDWRIFAGAMAGNF
jgi:hypothetical protein